MTRLAAVVGAFSILTLAMTARADLVHTDDLVLIDDFLIGDLWTMSASGSQTDLDPGGVHIMGGQRDTSFTVLGGAPSLRHFYYSGSFKGIECSSNGPDGLATWTVEYGKTSNLNEDLLEEYRYVFTLAILYNDSANPVPIAATAVSGNESPETRKSNTVTKYFSEVFGEPAPFDSLRLIYFPYAEFPDVDFTDVDYVSFTFGGNDPLLKGLDFASGAYFNCPEPATLSLLLLGGLALIRRRG